MNKSIRSAQRFAANGTFVLLACAAAATTAQATGKVEVQWVDPGAYSDAGRSVWDRESATRELDEHLVKLSRLLPDGQTLRLEITDLDLAGEIEPVGWHELRVLRGRADWPRISLRYTLSAANANIRSGQVQLSDLGYALSPRQASLGYEKRMLERWFKAEFGAP